jgi:hypothetical protein
MESQKSALPAGTVRHRAPARGMGDRDMDKAKAAQVTLSTISKAMRQAKNAGATDALPHLAAAYEILILAQVAAQRPSAR